MPPPRSLLFDTSKLSVTHSSEAIGTISYQRQPVVNTSVGTRKLPHWIETPSDTVKCTPISSQIYTATDLQNTRPSKRSRSQTLPYSLPIIPRSIQSLPPTTSRPTLLTQDG